MEAQTLPSRVTLEEGVEDEQEVQGLTPPEDTDAAMEPDSEDEVEILDKIV